MVTIQSFCLREHAGLFNIINRDPLEIFGTVVHGTPEVEIVSTTEEEADMSITYEHSSGPVTKRIIYKSAADKSLELGWALKEERKNKRFNVNQKEYLTEKFNKGLKTGRKEDPFLVSEEMLTERKEDGNRRFSYDEILSVQQITSFFSRMSRKNKSFDDSVDASREETITTIRKSLCKQECTH
ncbi:unnamed protein product [Mytilus edulis]|uniref:Uncharacterized protein n=1 Tax=Mytilus edulis TaxID=6550 RepID=A0A8S3VE25_MYTED|nr:unnamed protein product [Mytilus edulis]